MLTNNTWRHRHISYSIWICLGVQVLGGDDLPVLEPGEERAGVGAQAVRGGEAHAHAQPATGCPNRRVPQVERTG